MIYAYIIGAELLAVGAVLAGYAIYDFLRESETGELTDFREFDLNNPW